MTLFWFDLFMIIYSFFLYLYLTMPTTNKFQVFIKCEIQQKKGLHYLISDQFVILRAHYLPITQIFLRTSYLYLNS